MVDTKSLFQGELIDGEVYFALRCTLEHNVSHWCLHLGFPSVDVISLFSFFAVRELSGRALTSCIAAAEDLVKHRSPALLGAFSLVWQNYT